MRLEINSFFHTCVNFSLYALISYKKVYNVTLSKLWSSVIEDANESNDSLLPREESVSNSKLLKLLPSSNLCVDNRFESKRSSSSSAKQNPKVKVVLRGHGGAMVSALDFRSEGRRFEAHSLSSFCFLGQETLHHIVSLHPGI